jgi:tRNA pseudouridine-54 N-methylase
MSDYFSQNASFTMPFSSNSSWSIMAPIESTIKTKIEKLGIPLKEWNIQINRGILTGFNEAFIINSDTKEKLIRDSAESEKIIRPILRGRDIKRYKALFANNWIINAHNGLKSLNIDPINVKTDYPAVYEHLEKYQKELESRLDKGSSWTNLRNCAYLNDFQKEKIIWIELTDRPNFYLDKDGYYVNNTVFFMVGENLPYILSFLNSSICTWYFTKIAATSGVGTRRWIKIYVEQIKIPEITDGVVMISELVEKIQQYKKLGKSTKELENIIDVYFFNKFGLNNEEVEYINKTVLEI